MNHRDKGYCGKLPSLRPIFVLILGFWLAFFAPRANAQAPTWEAVGKVGASHPESGTNILGSAGGNFFLAGRFQNNTVIAGTTLTAQYGNETVIMKMDTSGTIAWWLDIYGQALNEDIVGMVSDAAGNLFIAGNFETYLEIDSVALSNTGGGNDGAYLAKISANGVLDWVREISICKNQRVAGLAMDATGRLLLGGQFADTAIVDSDTLFAVGGSDLFTAAFDTTGQMVWVESFGSPDFDVVWAFSGNSQGEIALASILRDSALVDGAWHGQGGNETLVITRQDRNGNYRFVIEEPDVTSQDELFQLDICETNEIFLGGNFLDSVALGNQMHYSGGSKDILLVKYNPVGTYQWSVAAPSSGQDELQSLISDDLGNVYITGYYSNSLTLGAYSVSSGSIIGDFFLAKVDGNGVTNWLENANAGFFDYVGGVDVDVVDGKVFITGDFTSTATFGGSQSVTAAGTSDMYWGYLCQAARVELAAGQGGSHCIGTSIPVQFYASGCFNSGNSFRVELSDSGGSFASPVIVGTQNGTQSGTISATLPYFLTGGNGYRFRVVANSPAWVSADNGSDMTVFTGSAATITSGGDSILCFGETATLNAGTGFLSYAWSTGASSQTINVTNGGIFSVAVISPDGCLSRDTFQVQGPFAPPPSPVIQPNGPISLCTGQTLTLDAGSGYFVYQWNTGAGTRTIQVSQPGSYFLTVENGFGCEGYSDTVQVSANIRPALTQIGDTIYCSIANASSYAWFRNGTQVSGANQYKYRPVLNGDFHVRILDAQSCTEYSDTLSFTTDIDLENQHAQWHVYPQPATDRLSISYDGKLTNATAEIWDFTGRILLREEIGTSTLKILNVQALPCGQYLLRLADERGTEIVKISIQR